ncbi:unnamed protein product [Alopecurus aequalis]
MEEENLLLRILDKVDDPTNLSLALLQRITGNFSEERKIGRGGFGEVYKGVLGEKIVAVKRIHINENTVDDKLFRREFDSLWNINHRNVVRFLGFCSNTYQKKIEEAGSKDVNLANIKERLLCFEYISNGSLDKHITDELRGLEWETRYEIITGICKGLRSLHEEKNIIHMDLKPANILLDFQDEKYVVPKITDFGLSRPNKYSHTLGPCYGTRGHLAPEYGEGSKTTAACDIYSLGAIIRELVTGCMEVPDQDNVLRRWRHRWNKPPTPLQYQQVTRCMEIAVRCREQKPEARPSISKIISSLSESEITGGHSVQESTYLDDDMLGIEPLELHYTFELNKVVSWSVKLTNRTNACFAFKIERPSNMYIIRPDKGVVTPGCNECLTVGAPQVTQDGDKFIVWSTKVSKGLTVEHITEHTFQQDQDDGKVVDKVYLMVLSEPTKPLKYSRSREDPEEVPETSRVTASTTCGSRQARSPLACLPAETFTHDMSVPERMKVLLSTVLWVVGKALAPVSDSVLGDWDSNKKLGLNVEALRRELRLVKGTLETASQKHIAGEAMEELLCSLRDSARSAEDLLDELDYFRIQDKLHDTYDAVNHRSRRNSPSSSTPSANQAEEEEVNASSASQSTLSGVPQRGHAEETPILGFNRVDVSERMKNIVEQLQPVRTDFTNLMQSCDHITPDIAQSRSVTTGRSIEPKLYGRDNIASYMI